MTDQEQPCGAETDKDNTAVKVDFTDYMEVALILHLSEQRKPSSANLAPLDSLSVLPNAAEQSAMELESCCLNNSQVRALLPLSISNEAAPTLLSAVLKHLWAGEDVGWGGGALMLLYSCGSDQSFLVLKSCSTLLHPSIISTGFITSATCRAVSNVGVMHYGWKMRE